MIIVISVDPTDEMSQEDISWLKCPMAHEIFRTLTGALLFTKGYVNKASFHKRRDIFSQIKKITTQAIKNNCTDYLP